MSDTNSFSNSGSMTNSTLNGDVVFILNPNDYMDKKIEVYNIFRNFYDLCIFQMDIYKKNKLNPNCEIEPEPRADLKKIICDDVDNISGKIAKEEFYCYRKKSDAEENFDKYEDEKLYKKWELYDRKFCKDSLTKLRNSKFVFSGDISNIVIKFSEILLNGIFDESNAKNFSQYEFEEHFLDEEFTKELNRYMEKIESENIISKMEAEIIVNKSETKKENFFNKLLRIILKRH